MRRRACTMAIFLAFLLVSLFHQSSAQYCRVAPPLDSCNTGGPAVVDNDIIGPGVTKYFYGPTATLNQVTIRGGKLIVCGNLTLSNAFNLDSGTVVIRPGASLTGGGPGGTGMSMKGGTAIYNYGSFLLTTNINLEGPYSSATRPNIIMNVTKTAYFRSFTYFTINDPNSFFINNGIAELGGIITDLASVPGSVCMGSGSHMRQSVMINKIKGAYTVPYGHGCVQVTSYAEFLDSLGANPGVLACVAAGTTTATGTGKKPWAWGRATVFNTCPNCAGLALLPIKVTKFGARPLQQGYQLSWQAEQSSSRYLFALERSTDGVHFSTIDSFLSTGAQQYQRDDVQAPAGALYYRLRYYNDMAYMQYSVVVKVYNDGAVTDVQVFPNPFTTTINLSWQPGKAPLSIVVAGATGNIISQQQPAKTVTGLSFSLPAALPPGHYMVRIIYPEKVYVKKMVKEGR